MKMERNKAYHPRRDSISPGIGAAGPYRSWTAYKYKFKLGECLCVCVCVCVILLMSFPRIIHVIKDLILSQLTASPTRGAAVKCFADHRL